LRQRLVGERGTDDVELFQPVEPSDVREAGVGHLVGAQPERLELARIDERDRHAVVGGIGQLEMFE